MKRQERERREREALRLVRARSDLCDKPPVFTHDAANNRTWVRAMLWDGRAIDEMVIHIGAESFLCHAGDRWRWAASERRADGMLVRA